MESILDHKTRNEVTVQLLESSKEGVKTYFISGKTPLSSEQQNLLTSGGFFSSPFEIRDETVIMTFVGDSKNLMKLFDLSKKMDIHYKIVSSTDATFSADSPLNGLTQKQREVLTVAFENGYYDSPKRIDSRQLADKLHIKCSTLVEHRRKAEERLIAQVLKHHNR